MSGEGQTSVEGLGRGRRSPGCGPRVLGCGPVLHGAGIVPAAQATMTVAHTAASESTDPEPPQTHSLMPKLSERHLRHALRQCGRRASAPGADGMSWAQLRATADSRLPALAQQLADGSWTPGHVREVAMPTYTGKRMITYVPTVLDRTVQRALRNVIEPVLEAQVFRDWVSGFRPGRNRITALRQAANYRNRGLGWVADLDVATVSEGADLDEVVNWHAEHIHDGTFLARLRTALSAMPSPIAPGSGLAPMLITLRLSQVDAMLSSLRVVRFADNYTAFARTRDEAQDAFYAISDALLLLRLRPNETKSRIRENTNVEDLFLIGG